jgi:Protein of unknown function (DUF805)
MNRAAYWLCLAILATIYTAANVFGQKHVAVSEGILFLLCVPRLHDIGLSGWWCGIAFLLEIAVVAASLMLLPLSEARIPMGIFVLMLVVALIWLGIKRGEPGPNRFGEPPSRWLSFKKTAQPTSTDLRA